MILWKIHGDPNNALNAAQGDEAYDVDTQPNNYFKCDGGTVWIPTVLTGGPSAAYGGVVQAINLGGAAGATVAKTTSGADLLNAAAEQTGRSRDRINNREQVMLQGFIANDFPEVFDAEYWPDLIPAFLSVGVADKQFSKNVGSADPGAPEMGDILTVASQDPRVCDRYRVLDFTELDNAVAVDSCYAVVWVEYMLPYPGVTFPDLNPDVLALNAFRALDLPRRFRQVLVHKAAAALLQADGDVAGASAQRALAEQSWVRERNRLPAPPAWRRIRVKPGYGRRRHQPWPGFLPVTV